MVQAAPEYGSLLEAIPCMRVYQRLSIRAKLENAYGYVSWALRCVVMHFDALPITGGPQPVAVGLVSLHVGAPA